MPCRTPRPGVSGAVQDGRGPPWRPCWPSRPAANSGAAWPTTSSSTTASPWKSCADRSRNSGTCGTMPLKQLAKALGGVLILYEYPFNESIRTMLRLEHLFKRLELLASREAPVDHHYALATLFEIMDVASRADIKSDLLKELDRYKGQFETYRGNPAIQEGVLQQVLQRIEHAYQGLIQLQGKAGQALAANDWLMSIRSRISIPGGTCEFDLPSYYAWQHEPAARRQSDLQQWAGT